MIEKILFIVLASILLLVILFVIFFPIFRKRYIAKNFKNVYGKKIYKIALNNDYLLINKNRFQDRIESFIDIDHILFGDKYIYIINDKYFDGTLSAKENDNGWIYKPYSKKKESTYIDNPIIENKNTVNNFARLINYDTSFFISIIVLNKNCKLENLSLTSNRDYVVNITHLNKLIKTIEKRDVQPLKRKSVDRVANEINDLKVAVK